MKHNYGITHGLIVLPVMYILSLFLVFPLPSIAGGVLSIYYYIRESKARTKDHTPKFKDWYLDSQMDAVVPILTTILFTFFQVYF